MGRAGVNLANLKKDEILKRYYWKCVHGHNGLEHPKCFDSDHRIKEKLGFLDIETTNLNATYGYVVSYCIKVYNGEIAGRVLSPQEIKRGIYDKQLLKEFCKVCRGYDRLVGYYSSRFDVPYLRTRSSFWGLDFPLYKEITHTDIYLIVKNKFKFHSNRLGVVAPFLGISAKSHPMNPEVWFGCARGDKKSLDYVLKHNREDVVSTEKLWDKINNYARITQTSI